MTQNIAKARFRLRAQQKLALARNEVSLFWYVEARCLVADRQGKSILADCLSQTKHSSENDEADGAT